MNLSISEDKAFKEETKGQAHWLSLPSMFDAWGSIPSTTDSKLRGDLVRTRLSEWHLLEHDWLPYKRNLIYTETPGMYTYRGKTT